MITQPGSVCFWLDPAENPAAFLDGANFKWNEFKLGPEHCVIISEGKNLVAKMNPGTEREFLIFSIIPPYSATQRHMVALTWSTEELVLYWDGKPLHTCRFEDF